MPMSSAHCHTNQMLQQTLYCGTAELCDSEQTAIDRLWERRPMSVNCDELLGMMQATRNECRSCIKTQHQTIAEIFQRYPLRLMDMSDAVCIKSAEECTTCGSLKVRHFCRQRHDAVDDAADCPVYNALYTTMCLTSYLYGGIKWTHIF